MGLGRGHSKSQVHGQPAVPRKASDGGEDVRSVGGCSRRARERSEAALAERRGPSRAGRARSDEAGHRWADGARRQRAPRERRGGVGGAAREGGGLWGRGQGRRDQGEAVPEEGAPSGGLVLPARRVQGARGPWTPGAGSRRGDGCQRGSWPRGPPSPQVQTPLGDWASHPRSIRVEPEMRRGPSGRPRPRIAIALYLSEGSALPPTTSWSRISRPTPHTPTGGRREVPELHPTPPRSGLGGRIPVLEAEGGRGGFPKVVPGPGLTPPNWGRG